MTTQQESKTKAGAEPMDKAAREAGAPQDFTPRPRDAYAVVTLITEVQAIFPDMEVETFGPNGRGVSLDVAFYDDDEPDLSAVLALLGDPAYTAEPRIEEVARSTNDNCTIVTIINDPSLYDRREPFGIAGAIEVMSSEEGEPDLIDPDDEPGFDALFDDDAVDTEDVEKNEPEALDEDDELTEEEDTEPEEKPGHYIYRSSITGRIVTEAYAKRNPDKTQQEWVADSEEDE